MNSSKGTPFFFDENIFDEDAPGGVRTKKKIVEDPPIYTQKQMEDLRQKAFEEGVIQGQKEAEEHKNRMIMQIVSNLEMHIKNIELQELERKEQYEAESLHLCFHALKRAFPLYHATYGTQELEAKIKDVLIKYNTPETLCIELSGTVLAVIQEALSHGDGTTGKSLSFVENSKLGDSEFHISWSTGGIIYNRDDVLNKIMEILEETLARKGINVHDDENIETAQQPQTSTDQDD